MDIQNLLPANLLLQVRGFTPARAMAISYALISLISVIVGWVAMARASRVGSGKRRAIVALILGLIGATLSIIHLAQSTGSFGTGSGKLGAIIALVLAVTGIILGGLALRKETK